MKNISLATTVNSPLRAPPPLLTPSPLAFLAVFGHISANNGPIFIL